MFLIESYFDWSAVVLVKTLVLTFNHMRGSWFDLVVCSLLIVFILGQGVWPTSVLLDLGVVNRNLTILV